MHRTYMCVDDEYSFHKISNLPKFCIILSAHFRETPDTSFENNCRRGMQIREEHILKICLLPLCTHLCSLFLWLPIIRMMNF
jgi:hypothetical protein